ncbi:hypothetical protein ACLOJK_035628 [Asimina triloba]
MEKVGNAFVEQYYHILHQSPELVYRFYQNSSVMSRPEPNGDMTTVTTMQEINDKIVSLGYNDIKAEIKTADAQDSHNGGVIVLVTGCLTGKDNVKRKFTQTFFLATQDVGYFVLNDVFRYMDEFESVEDEPAVVNGVPESSSVAPLTPNPEAGPASGHHVADPETPVSEEDLNNGEEVCNPSDNEDGSVIEEEVVGPSAHSSQNEVRHVLEPSSTPEDAPKKSYASIVKVTKESAGTSVVNVPMTTVCAAPANTERQPAVPPVSAPEQTIYTPSDNTNPEGSNLHEEAEGHSIYIRGLPLSATVPELEEEFKKFGPIKPGGIQVRSNRSAIEASPINFRGRQAFIEEKRTTTRGNSLALLNEISYAVTGGGRGRFPTGGRGGFRNNDNFRGRGYFGGRGYGRNDFGNRGEFSGRGRGPSGRGSAGYQRVDQNGTARVGRSGSGNQTPVTA